MISFDPGFLAIAIPAVFLAGVSKGGFGSGASFVAAAILALILPPGLALGIMLPLLMLIDVAALRPYWRKWHGPSAMALVIGAVPGVALGAAVYSFVPADAFRVLIGLVCLAFVAFQLSAGRGQLQQSRWGFSRVWGWLTGVFAGFTSFISHAGGPPVAVYLLGQGMAKTPYQATTVIVFWVINLLKLGPFWALGLFTKETLLAGVVLAPFALLGTWAGVRAHAWISPRAFFAVTYILLVGTGARLIWLGLA